MIIFLSSNAWGCVDDDGALQRVFGSSTSCSQIASFGLCDQVIGTATVVDFCQLSCGACSTQPDTTSSPEGIVSRTSFSKHVVFSTKFSFHVGILLEEVVMFFKRVTLKAFTTIRVTIWIIQNDDLDHLRLVWDIFGPVSVSIAPQGLVMSLAKSMIQVQVFDWTFELKTI